MSKNTIAKIGMTAFLGVSTTIGAPVTMYFEGVRLIPYYDSAGVKTWCAGETEVGYKDKFTYEECSALFKVRLGYYSFRTAVMYNDTAKNIVTPKIHASMTDMSYNVGLSQFGRSGMLRNLNAGNATGACNYILKYKFVAGRNCFLPENKSFCGGIKIRREKAQNMCMEGINVD